MIPIFTTLRVSQDNTVVINQLKLKIGILIREKVIFSREIDSNLDVFVL